MAETVGSLADKISIIELKRYYMARQTERQDVDEEHRRTCLHKLGILTEQRDDLIDEIDTLFHAVMSHRQQLKVYRQYKMYNDPAYREQCS
ncbi:hypothetical protein CSB45_08475 [candidate division KSB3 bacterium]|uniref:DUF4254 domain-containing protein n=1 Tax=candidate division KSB3 bacterium TaxID=2044937 RepID=A0A2G6E658_9BACT|nr:MAG: hypothetical protein CSB45_08475 [candidate division KSB3 bacterium]PIE29747.1 MAG: hypothetical protein CSA57_06740 [candidate division KSB3 bacterium]